MRCLEWREKMSLRLDGRLSAADEMLLDDHLASCPACAEEWQRWQEVDCLFRTAPAVEAPVDLAERVLARLKPAPSPRALVGSFALLALGAVALLAIYLVPVVLGALQWGVDGDRAASAFLALLGLGVRVLQVCLTLADGCRLFCWALLSSPSMAVILVYAFVALLALGVWLRLVIKPASVRERA